MVYLYTDRRINQRETQQDQLSCLRLSLSTGETLWALIAADGMGGLKNGAMYASIAVKKIQQLIVGILVDAEQMLNDSPNLLSDVLIDDLICAQSSVLCETVNRQVVDEAARMELGDGGTTAAVAILFGSRLYVFNAGDSPVYLRRADGTVNELSVRDNLAEEAVRERSLERNTDEYYSLCSKLTSYIGMTEDETVTHFTKVEGLMCGDTVILGTDGGFGEVITSADHLSEFLTAVRGGYDICRNLIRESTNTSWDNQTLIVAEIVDEKNEPVKKPVEFAPPQASVQPNPQKKGLFRFGKK